MSPNLHDYRFLFLFQYGPIKQQKQTNEKFSLN